MESPAGAAPAAPQLAAAAATALLWGTVPGVSVQAALSGHLFPGCSYLALAVCQSPPPLAGEGGGDLLLLLTANLLTPSQAASSQQQQQPAGAHFLRRSLVGAAMLAGRPQACCLAAGAAQQGWTDMALAAQHGATSLLCLPFKVAAPLEDAASGSNCCGRSGKQDGSAVAAALLLGWTAPEQEGTPSAGCSATQQRMRGLLRLAAALTHHAQRDLAQAAAAAAVLGSAAAPAAEEEEGTEGEEGEEEEEEEEGGSQAAVPGGTLPGCLPEGEAAAAAAATTAAAAAEQGGGSTSLPSAAAGASGSFPLQGQLPSNDALPAGAPTPPLQSDFPAPAERAGRGGAAAAAAAGSSAAPRGGAAGAAGPAADAGAAPRGRLRYLLHLCHGLLEQQLLLPSSRRGMRLDWLLRFQEQATQLTGPLAPQWGPSGSSSGGSYSSAGGSTASGSTASGSFASMRSSSSGSSSSGSGASVGERQGAGTVGAGAGEAPWSLSHQQWRRGPTLEDRFLCYHSRLMADKLDAAAALILLAILILLVKEASSPIRLGHPLFCAITAVLAMPLAALLPGAPRTWYVRRRERVMQLFFVVALLYQQATNNHLESHASRSSQARYVNAGYAWITVDGLLMQMRFCRALPTLATCFFFNLRPIGQTCARYHAHMDPRHCAAAGFRRGVFCLLVPLAVIYLLELRVRRNWLLRWQREAANAAAAEAAAAAGGEAEERLEQQQLRQQLRAERRQARRLNGGPRVAAGGAAAMQ